MTFDSVLAARKTAIESLVDRENYNTVNSVLELFLIEYLISGGVSITGGVTVGDVGLKNAAGTAIDPATSQLQTAIRDEHVVSYLVTYTTTTATTTNRTGLGIFLANRGTNGSSLLFVIGDTGSPVLPAAINSWSYSAGSAAAAASNPFVQYRINGAGATLFGTLDPATGIITPVGGGTAVTVGTGATNAVLQASSTPAAAASNPFVQYRINGAGATLFGTLDPATGIITPVGGGTAVTVGTGATEAVLQASATPAASSTPTLVLFDIVGGLLSQRGYQVGTEVQPLGWTGGARLTVGTATGNATNLRAPEAVALRSQSYLLSAAVSEVAAFTVPAALGTVVVTANQAAGTLNAANGVMGGNAKDVADIQLADQYVFAVSTDGLRVGGLYQVVSGTIAGGLTIRRVYDGALDLMLSSGQAAIAAGASTGGTMQLAVYTRIEPIAGQTFYTIESKSGDRVLAGALEGIRSPDTAIASAAIASLLQGSARNLSFASTVGPLHSRLSIGEDLGDNESSDILGANPLLICGKGSSADNKDAIARVTWYAGFYPGGRTNA